jgi:hypothetical protein
MELLFFTVFLLLLGPMLGAGRRIAAGHLTWTLDSRRISMLMIAFVPGWFTVIAGRSRSLARWPACTG